MPKILIILGLCVAALGLILQVAPWLVTWVGRLPGDVNYQGERTSIYFPWVSMLVISVIATLIVNLFSTR